MDEIPETVAWELVADLLEILAWSTADNDAHIMRSVERWLHDGTDIRKINIGLSLEAYPFLDRLEMERVLERLVLTYPELNAKCQDLIASRRKLNE